MARPELVKVEALRAFTDTTPEGQFHADPNSHLEDGRFVKVPASRVQRLIDLGWAKLADPDLPQLDHDHDGQPGGSEPHDPPALSGKTKAELLAIAADEGIDVEAIEGTGSGGNVLNADIVAAIEAARAAADDDIAP